MIPTNEIHNLIKSNREFAERLADWLNLDLKTTSDGIIDAISDLDSKGLEKLWQVVAPTDPEIVRVQRNGSDRDVVVDHRGASSIGEIPQPDSSVLAGRYQRRNGEGLWRSA